MYTGPASGLFTNPNPFSGSPPGSLAVADDVVFIAPGVIEPRHGMGEMDSSSFGSAGSLADAIAFYGSSILVAYDLTTVAIRPAGGPFTDFDGIFEPNGNNRMRFELAARSVFFNPADGVRMYDGAKVTFAGSPQGLNITAVNAAAHGWQLPDTAVAYRYTVCRKDAFGRIIEGASSGRYVLRNSIVSTFGSSGVTRSSNVVHVTSDLPHGLATGNVVTLAPGEANFPAGAKTVTIDNVVQFHYAEVGANANATVTQNWLITRSAALTLWLPGEGHAGAGPGVVSTDDFLRVYRSEMTESYTDDSGFHPGAGITPDDSLYQCYETPYLSATDISNGFFAFNDIAPESSLEVPLYTNPNDGDGALAANYQPPLAVDMAYWQNQMWFLNTTGRHALEFTLLGTGSPDGLQLGDTVTVAFADAGPERVYTAATASAGSAFELFLYGDPGYNIAQTAQSLVQAMNADLDNENFIATYVSAEGGTPGRIRLEAIAFGDQLELTLFSSRSTPWTPQLPDFTTPLWLPPKSTNNRHAARLYRSKPGQPEAVPVTNFLQIDVDNHAGLRVVPLKYRLIVFKDDGVYFVPNTEPLDFQKLSDAVLIAPDSVAKMGDVVYCLTDMGIAAISDSGITFISVPIDNTLVDLSSPASLESLQRRTVGVGYRSARQYLCWLIEQEPGGGPFTGNTFSADNEQAFVYSTLAQGYTRYTFGARAAAVNALTDTLVVAPTNSNVLWEERKTRTAIDYVDLLYGMTPLSIDGSELAFSAGDVLAAGIEVGDAFVWRRATYLIVDVDGDVVTVLGQPIPTAGDGFHGIAKAIPTQVIFNDMTDGAPATMKFAQQCCFLFKQNAIRAVTAQFSSEVHPAIIPVDLLAKGWGEFAWGEVPWGGVVQAVRRVEPLPVGAANCCQLSVGFRTRQAFAKYAFVGIDVVSKPDTTANRG